MFRRIQKLLGELKHYPRLRDKLLSLYNVLLVSRKLRPVPFPGRRKPVNVFVHGHVHPFAVRLGSTDWLVLVEIFLDSEYAEVGRLFSDSHPTTIIDLGANVGFSVRYWLEAFPGARVIAVEPDAENCAMIQRNIALCCPADSPEVVQACIVGQPRDSVFFETGSGREWTFAMSNLASPTTRSIRGITMDNLITERAITGPIDFLKCDIEGGEVELFAHCDSWIQHVRGGVIEVHGQFSVANFLCILKEKKINLTHWFSDKSSLCFFKALTPH
jgi:FkbM family methyltransferase